MTTSVGIFIQRCPTAWPFDAISWAHIFVKSVWSCAANEVVALFFPCRRSSFVHFVEAAECRRPWRRKLLTGTQQHGEFARVRAVLCGGRAPHPPCSRQSSEVICSGAGRV